MTVRERIEQNIVVFFLGTLVAGFLAGIGAYDRIQAIAGMTPVARGELDRLKREAESPRPQRWLRIRGVEGLDGLDIRIVADVNGSAYSYPSKAVWARVRSQMSVEDFPLPMDQNEYRISFRVLALSSGAGEFSEFQSQEFIKVRSWPFESDYRVSRVVVRRTGSVRGGDAGSVRGGDAGSVKGADVDSIKGTRDEDAGRIRFEIRQ